MPPAPPRWRLRADLTARTKRAQGQPAARAELRQTLGHWRADADLAGARDAAALAQLPAAERQAWRQFWAEVDQLRQAAAPAP
jgi:hypothetical protein